MQIPKIQIRARWSVPLKQGGPRVDGGSAWQTDTLKARAALRKQVAVGNAQHGLGSFWMDVETIVEPLWPEGRPKEADRSLKSDVTFGIDTVSDTVRQSVWLQIKSVAFENQEEWCFSDGTTAFLARISDPEFLLRIDSNNVRFGKGDALMADLRRVQRMAQDGLTLEYTVQRVLEHHAGQWTRGI